MEHHDSETLIKILAKQATFAPVGPQAFFRNLVLQANLPESFVMQVIGIWSGNPDIDARTLVQWANNQGINPQDPRFTVLGSLVQPLLQNVGLDTAGAVIALIVHYGLYRDLGLLGELPIQYKLVRTVKQSVPITPIGPEFNWQGPSDQQELQTFLQPRRVMTLDAAFIQRGIEQIAGVCQIELVAPTTGDSIPLGTGFLIQPNLLLTNYHVLAPELDSDPSAYLSEIVLRFGYLTSPDGKAMQGQIFKLSEHPIRASSSTNRLDYALLEVENSILGVKDIHPVNIHAEHQPAKGMGINLLHHSEGKTMKFALGTNGITGVYESEGLIQYYSETAGGASGSPCFNDDWQVVALHHAQKAGTFGVYCEGILLSQIKEDAALKG
jgi:V8-like Glu-specific endopeptidase